MVLERPTGIRCLKQDVRFPRVCESNEKIRRALLLGGDGWGEKRRFPVPPAATHTHESREGRRLQPGSFLRSSAEERFGEQRGRRDLNLTSVGRGLCPCSARLCKDHRLILGVAIKLTISIEHKELESPAFP